MNVNRPCRGRAPVSPRIRRNLHDQRPAQHCCTGTWRYARMAVIGFSATAPACRQPFRGIDDMRRFVPIVKLRADRRDRKAGSVEHTAQRRRKIRDIKRRLDSGVNADDTPAHALSQSGSDRADFVPAAAVRPIFDAPPDRTPCDRPGEREMDGLAVQFAESRMGLDRQRENNPFMTARQREYFRLRLRRWRRAIFADRSTSKSERLNQLGTRDHARTSQQDRRCIETEPRRQLRLLRGNRRTPSASSASKRVPSPPCRSGRRSTTNGWKNPPRRLNAPPYRFHLNDRGRRDSPSRSFTIAEEGKVSQRIRTAPTPG